MIPSEVGNSLMVCRNSGKKFLMMAVFDKLRPVMMLLIVSANVGRDSSWKFLGSQIVTVVCGTSHRIVLPLISLSLGSWSARHLIVTEERKGIKFTGFRRI